MLYAAVRAHWVLRLWYDESVVNFVYLSMASIYVTRRIPEVGLTMLKDAGHTLDISEKDGVLTREELLAALKAKPYDAVLCLLTDTIDAAVFDAVPTAKIFANYAVGFNNIDVTAAKARGITITNTPGALTDTVAEHTIALMLAITSRIAEGDRLVRAGKFDGWGPMMLLGTDLKGKMLGLIGAGRIGGRVAQIASLGLGMQILYTDVAANAEFEQATGARFVATPEAVLKDADVVSIHVPLLPTTTHLINGERLKLMKPGSYLVNTSRGPVIDESALVAALKAGVIKGAALDVFEHEPTLAPGLAELENVVVTPHIASATDGARNEMAVLAAENLIAVLKGEAPKNPVA
jgi:glyoxylate reductase